MSRQLDTVVSTSRLAEVLELSEPLPSGTMPDLSAFRSEPVGPFRDGWTKQDAEEVLRRGDPDELLYVPIVITLDCPDLAWAVDVCVQLAGHPHALVRGNALLGLGYLSRQSKGSLPMDCIDLVLRGLDDSSDWVRKQAAYAVSEIRVFQPADLPSTFRG